MWELDEFCPQNLLDMSHNGEQRLSLVVCNIHSCTDCIKLHMESMVLRHCYLFVQCVRISLLRILTIPLTIHGGGGGVTLILPFIQSSVIFSDLFCVTLTFKPLRFDR